MFRTVLITSVVVWSAVCAQSTASGAVAESDERPRIVIDAAAPRVAVSPELYGIFFEEISRAGEGGLCAELVQNRDLEAINLPEGWRQEGKDIYTAKGRHYNQWWQSPTPAWSLVKDGTADGSIALEKANPLNDRNPNSLKLTATRTRRTDRRGQLRLLGHEHPAG